LAQFLGYSPKELINKPFSEITFKDDIEIGKQKMLDLIEGKTQSLHYEKRYIHKNGDILWALLAGSIVSDSNGKLLYLVAQIKNITERKVAEEKLAQLPEDSRFTNEQVTADYFRSVNVQFQPVVFERTDQAQAALVAGRCDSFGTDASQLAGVRASMPNPREWTILPERFSKEPYGAYVRRGDDNWYDIIRWYTTAVIEAEEQGITRANAEEQRRTSTNPNTRRLLGVTPELGQSLRLDPAWAYNVIRAIGNYGELYERTMGENTPVALPRGPNNLWNNGGLMYALPMR
jgi:general L-amino acid transport system substrate-binding protein